MGFLGHFGHFDLVTFDLIYEYISIFFTPIGRYRHEDPSEEK